MSENIYAEFEGALMAVLTDQDNRMELRDALHRARSKIDRTNGISIPDNSAVRFRGLPSERDDIRHARTAAPLFEQSA